MRRSVLGAIRQLLGAALFAGSWIALLWLVGLMELSR